MFYYDGSDYIEHDFFRKNRIKNTVENNFEAPAQSSKKNKSNKTTDDKNNPKLFPKLKRQMDEKLPTFIETEVRPVLKATKVIVI